LFLANYLPFLCQDILVSLCKEVIHPNRISLYLQDSQLLRECLKVPQARLNLLRILLETLISRILPLVVRAKAKETFGVAHTKRMAKIIPWSSSISKSKTTRLKAKEKTRQASLPSRERKTMVKSNSKRSTTKRIVCTMRASGILQGRLLANGKSKIPVQAPSTLTKISMPSQAVNLIDSSKNSALHI
jgi:hypothetical protein